MLELISPLCPPPPRPLLTGSQLPLNPIKEAPSGSNRHGYGYNKGPPVPLWLSALSGMVQAGAGNFLHQGY